MKLHWMRWISLKEFERHQQRESHFGRARAVKRRRELDRRGDRLQIENILKIFPELVGRP